MITIPGQLAIKTIHGRNGDFNVGRLATSIGEFVVKNAELDQYAEGKYDGDAALFDTLWPLGDVVKLDATVDRRVLRQQRDRLGDLGYEFAPLSQDWHLTRV